MENRKFLIKKRVIIPLLLYLFFPIWISCLFGPCQDGQWVFFHGDEMTGRVVDAETGNPVEEVIVIADWQIREIFGADPITALMVLSPVYWIDENMNLPRKLGSGKNIVTATDKDGRYVIPAWTSFQPWTYRYHGPENPHFCIYKPGYKTLWYSYKWMMNDKDIAADINKLLLTKSLTAKEIEEDFDIFRPEGLYGLVGQERIKAVGLIEKALKDMPAENTKAIRKYFKK